MPVTMNSVRVGAVSTSIPQTSVRGPYGRRRLGVSTPTSSGPFSYPPRSSSGTAVRGVRGVALQGAEMTAAHGARVAMTSAGAGRVKSGFLRRRTWATPYRERSTSSTW